MFWMPVAIWMICAAKITKKRFQFWTINVWLEMFPLEIYKGAFDRA